MKTIRWLVGIAALASFSALAATPPSQVRGPEEDFSQAQARYLKGLAPHGTSALGSAHPFDDPWSVRAQETLPSWPDEASLRESFEKIRDDRFLLSRGAPDFPRRIPWLYPDDGCYARAALVGSRFEDWGNARPKKLFIFGNLRLRTPNAPTGWVYWWYHVASIVQLESGEPRVLDPAIDPSRPLLWREWAFQMTSNLSNVRFSLCEADTYAPESSCTHPASADQAALRDAQFFLPREWNRLIHLGRDPRLELGASPPWNLNALSFSNLSN